MDGRLPSCFDDFDMPAMEPADRRSECAGPAAGRVTFRKVVHG
jgi:hypothetical protein